MANFFIGLGVGMAITGGPLGYLIWRYRRIIGYHVSRLLEANKNK